MKRTTKQYAQALYAALQDGKADEKTVLKNFVSELAKARKMRNLPAILSRITTLHDTAQGITRVSLTVSEKLSAKEEAHIAAALTKALGTTVVLNVDIDASVIGGAVLHYDDTKINATARAALAQVQTALTTS